MNASTGLTPEDQVYRRTAETYFAEKSPMASAHFESRLLEVFRGFEEHWRAFFAPDDVEQLREYVATPPALRRAQFERFHRECRSWELNFQLSKRSTNGRRPTTEGERERDEFKRRLEKQNDREAEVREFYAGLGPLLEKQRVRPMPPPDVLGHMRVLGVEPDTTFQDIKSQYRRLARLYHPDRAGDQTKMQRVNTAFRAVMHYYKRVPVQS